MKKLFCGLAAVFALTVFAAKAQLPYNVTINHAAYNALSGATSINGNTIWDDDVYAINLPFSFKFGGTITTTRVFLDLGNGAVVSDTTGIASAIIYSDADLADRGIVSGTQSLSPIRYLVTGATPNRIFKIELHNAGFYNDLLATDSLDMQIWLYENSAFEVRYGSSKITVPNNYFSFGYGPLVGFLKNEDFSSSTADALYNLSGAPDFPSIDSIDLVNNAGNPLNAYPDSDVVYRFAPKAIRTAVGVVFSKISLSVYPTLCHDRLDVIYGDDEAAAYTVISLQGKIIRSGGLSRGANNIDLENLPAGSYWLQAQNSSGKMSRRFTKL